jgi:hypothetical protein
MKLGSGKVAAVLAVAALAGGLGAGVAAGAKRPHAPRVLLKAAANYLELDRATLAKDVRSGQTLAQIANARGKSVDGLQGAMVAAVKAQLDAAVSAGRLSSPREQQVLARVQKLVGRLCDPEEPRPRGRAGGELRVHALPGSIALR